MKSKGFILVIGAVAFVPLIAYAVSAEPGTNCSNVYPRPNCVYLPMVFRMLTPTSTNTPTSTITPTSTATPTPLPTPTLTPTPASKLQDGYYVADLTNNGSLWFTVKASGALASDGGFYFQVAPWCPWAVYSYSFETPINNKGLSFIVIDYQGREILARLSCNSTSSTQASCSAYQSGLGYLGQCGHMNGNATLR